VCVCVYPQGTFVIIIIIIIKIIIIRLWWFTRFVLLIEEPLAGTFGRLMGELIKVGRSAVCYRQWGGTKRFHWQ
jgi:hypothetical protein